MKEDQLISDALTHVKKLKAANMKIYGIMAHGLVPEELIYAADGFPLRLSLIGDTHTVNAGIKYLTAATCSFAKSTIGEFALKNDLYGKLDAIIAGNYCNGELCSTELISEYFKIPRINITFPSTKNDSALKFMAAELNHFKEDIERFIGTKIPKENIAKAIQLCNKERQLLQTIAKTQIEREFVLSGTQCLDLIYKHLLFGVEVSIETLQEILTRMSDISSSVKGKKIIFAGSGVPIGDNIIQLLENYELSVIKNLTWTGLDYYTALVDENINPMDALAKYYINLENSGRMLLSEDFFTNLIKIFDESNADGIVFYLLKHCSIFPSVISARLKESFSERGIPYLEIKREYAITTDAQLQTRIQAFKEMIG